jgi:hypothetical protein
VEKSVGKSQFSIYIYIYIYINTQNKKEKRKNEMNWAGPVLAQPQGWTQTSRVGWADVPAFS